MNARLLIPAAVAAALVPAAPAGASMLELDARQCYVSGGPIGITGTGFTAGATVALSGDLTGSAVADAAGRVALQVVAPAIGGVAPRTLSVGATDQANAANAAPPVAFRLVSRLFGGNYAQAIGGRPRQRTAWRFAGFRPGRPIYGHFRFHGRTRRSYRFGVARGSCGTLTVRARRVPVRTVRAGLWTLQMDQLRRYSPRTADRRVLTFRISRTLRRR